MALEIHMARREIHRQAPRNGRCSGNSPGDPLPHADEKENSDVPVKTTRQPKLVAAGLALVLGCAAVGAALARRQSRTVAYLELARAIPAGSIIRNADLASASMSPPRDFDAIPASEASQVVGSRAVDTLVAGSLLVAGDITRAAPPVSGTALVGTSLDEDQAPASLAVGDTVLVVASGGSSASDPTVPAKAGVLANGTVFSISVGSTSGSIDVTVEVPATEAATVATASATGDVSLVELPASGPTGGAA
jgi:hypothetical protein